jgi:hypothetical protein
MTKKESYRLKTGDKVVITGDYVYSNLKSFIGEICIFFRFNSSDHSYVYLNNESIHIEICNIELLSKIIEE